MSKIHPNDNVWCLHYISYNQWVGINNQWVGKNDEDAREQSIYDFIRKKS